MERVKKGEKYWSILFDRLFNDDGFCVIWHCEDWENDVFSEIRFEQHNYFRTKEEAEAVARKLQAVLKGAEVIEWPSEEEMLGVAPITDGPYKGLGCGRRLGWRDCYDWLKTKIVK